MGVEIRMLRNRFGPKGNLHLQQKYVLPEDQASQLVADGVAAYTTPPVKIVRAKKKHERPLEDGDRADK